MNREEMRVVEFVVTEKSKSKKGKKASKKEVKKIGLFHVWAASGKGSKKFTGLVEDAETGLLIEIGYRNIRFLNDEELEMLTDAAILEAEALLEVTEFTPEATETTEEATTTEATTAEAEAPATEEKTAETKPRRTKKA